MRLVKTIIESCPIAKTTWGRITLPDTIIGNLAETVRLRHEWLVLLHGKRANSGLQIEVDHCSVPTHQQMTDGSVHLPEMELNSDVVGVLHSHHSMGAFFSPIDYQELNPRFATSVVIASFSAALGYWGGKAPCPTEKAFGFQYKAEGQVILPCGQMATIPFHLSVIGMEEDDDKISFEYSEESLYIGDCQLHDGVEGETTPVATQCGIKNVPRTIPSAPISIFQGDGSLSSEVSALYAAQIKARLPKVRLPELPKSSWSYDSDLGNRWLPKWYQRMRNMRNKK